MTTITDPNTTTTTTATTQPTRWPLERILFAMAGTVTLLSALLAAFVSPLFLLLAAVVGVNQWSYVLLRACPASLVLQRFGKQSQCHWTQD